MPTEVPMPVWNAADKAASLQTFAEWLHAQAVETFLRDKTHVHALFLFQDKGLASVNAVPPGTTPAALAAGMREAVQKYGLYAIVMTSEAWTYVPRVPRDHTVLQILDGEMNVADLAEGDRTEALLVSIESREGAHQVWIDPIVRSDKEVTLAPGRMLAGEHCLKLQKFF